MYKNLFNEEYTLEVVYTNKSIFVTVIADSLEDAIESATLDYMSEELVEVVEAVE